MPRRLPPIQAILLAVVLDELGARGHPVHSILIKSDGDIEVRLGPPPEDEEDAELERWRAEVAREETRRR